MGKEETLNYAFPPKVVNSARNNYRCYGCLGIIHTGRMFIANPVKDGKSVKTLRLCLLCAMLLKDKPDSTIKEGGFSDRLIPNCLRKKKAELLRKFKRNSTEAILEQIAK